jgi:hypothetical protein
MSFEANKQVIGLFPLHTSGASNVNEYRFCKLTAKTIRDAGDGVDAFGVCLLKNPVAGQAVPVQVAGIAMVKASAAIAQDAGVEVGADGRIETLGAGTRLGTALEAATAENDIIPVLLSVQ